MCCHYILWNHIVFDLSIDSFRCLYTFFIQFWNYHTLLFEQFQNNHGQTLYGNWMIFDLTDKCLCAHNHTKVELIIFFWVVLFIFISPINILKSLSSFVSSVLGKILRNIVVSEFVTTKLGLWLKSLHQLIWSCIYNILIPLYHLIYSEVMFFESIRYIFWIFLKP